MPLGIEGDIWSLRAGMYMLLKEIRLFLSKRRLKKSHSIFNGNIYSPSSINVVVLYVNFDLQKIVSPNLGNP